MENKSNEDLMESSSCDVFDIPGEPAIVINGLPPASSEDNLMPNAITGSQSLRPAGFGDWLEGREVQKLFGDKYFHGKVVKFDEEVGWYRVVYEDGDFEDLEWDELKEVLVPLDINIPLRTLALKINRKKPKDVQRPGKILAILPGFNTSAMDWGWLLVFAKGMVKPVAALAVVAMAVAMSYLQKLGLEGEMVYSIFRSFIQLSVIGFVLQFIFSQNGAFWIVLAYLFMVCVAGYTAGQRAKHIPKGKYVAGISILAGTSITLFLLIILRVFPFSPRYIIPVAGMMVGNSMTVTGVTMKKLRDDIKVQMNQVETALALGATPRQATLHQVKRALVLALSPVLDSAKTVGLISLPGAMTGMIMGGASPLEAIHLQIVVMNMMIGAATVSSIISTYLSWPSFFTKGYQLETQVFSADTTS